MAMAPSAFDADFANSVPIGFEPPTTGQSRQF